MDPVGHGKFTENINNNKYNNNTFYTLVLQTYVRLATFVQRVCILLNNKRTFHHKHII